MIVKITRRAMMLQNFRTDDEDANHNLDLLYACAFGDLLECRKLVLLEGCNPQVI
jgi:hypothetical protein